MSQSDRENSWRPLMRYVNAYLKWSSDVIPTIDDDFTISKTGYGCAWTLGPFFAARVMLRDPMQRHSTAEVSACTESNDIAGLVEMNVRTFLQ